MQLHEQAKSSFVLFSLGFRPFFLLSALSAVILMTTWGLLYTNIIHLNTYYGFIDWHSHEMLFGYTAGVIAGFLLTAVRNWTKVDTISKTPLAILAGLWLLARILPFTPISGTVIGLIDISFFFFLTLAIAHPVIKVKQWNNLIMVFILSALMTADILVQAQHLGFIENGVQLGNYLALYSILLIIQVVTGRVMPFFTRIVIPDIEITERPILETILLITLILLALAEMLAVNHLIIVCLAAVLFVAHLMRLNSWYSKPILKTPILWVLYAGYLWLLIGFGMKTLVGVAGVTNNLAIHAWTAGLIGITTYGMMVRVTLGHTGHQMIASKSAIVGFYLLFAAAIIRVILPLFFMAHYILWIELSSLLWVLAFVLFIRAYWPLLTQPGIDR